MEAISRIFGICFLLSSLAFGSISIFLDPRQYTNCIDELIPSGSPKYQLNFGHEVHSISNKKKTFEGPYYVLGLNEQKQLVLVKHNEQVFVKLAVHSLKIKSLRNRTDIPHVTSIAPTLINIWDQETDPFCHAAAVRNLLSDQKKSESNLEQSLHSKYPRSMFGYLHGQLCATQAILTEHNVTFASYSSTSAIFVAMDRHLEQGGTAIFAYQGNQQVSFSVTQLDIASKTTTEHQTNQHKFIWNPHHPKKNVGHSVYVKGKLPDGRYLLGDWGRWRVAHPSDLRTLVQGNMLFLTPSPEEPLGTKAMQTPFFSGDQSPREGDLIKIRVTPWYSLQKIEVDGLVMSYSPHDANKDQFGGRLNVYDWKNNRIVRFAGPFSFQRYHIMQPAQITRAKKHQIDKKPNDATRTVNEFSNIPFP